MKPRAGSYLAVASEENEAVKFNIAKVSDQYTKGWFLHHKRRRLMIRLMNGDWSRLSGALTLQAPQKHDWPSAPYVKFNTMSRAGVAD
jgi:hypothetical protein